MISLLTRDGNLTSTGGAETRSPEEVSGVWMPLTPTGNPSLSPPSHLRVSATPVRSFAFLHVLALLLVTGLSASCLGAADLAPAPRTIEIGNLIYAGTKSSKCFSDAVLKALRKDAQLDTPDKYTVTKLAEREGMARIAAALMTGEGSFTLTAPERVVLKDWLERGGFLIASSSCSSKEWSVSFRAEAEKVFGKGALVSVAADHPLFSTVYQLKGMPLKNDGSARFEGIMIDGRLACLFSPEGLNDTAQVAGCCCCGGNEVKNAQQVVANALAYALVE